LSLRKALLVGTTMAKIIVIENEDYVRSNLIELLDAEGYQTIEAKNGEEAYRLISQELPDLIICDILMPELDGYGLLARCSQEPQTALIPFIFLTALTEREDLRKGMELGADDFITKPYTRSEILRAIEARIDKRAMVEKLSEEKILKLESKMERSIPYELLEPISTLLRYSDSLIHQNDSLNTSDFSRIGSEIQRTLSKLLDLIQNYVLYSELGNTLLDGEKLSWIHNSSVQNGERLITEIVISKLALEGRDKDLVLRLDEGEIKIAEFHLHKIIEIILDNIISRSEKGKEFEIQGISNHKKHKYYLRVIDHGRMIEEDERRAINSSIQLEGSSWPDYKLDKPDIGILVVKRILDIYNGSLIVSVKDSVKTQFQIELPMPEK
jgi:two-component system, sensor histidine kinase and response regulator